MPCKYPCSWLSLRHCFITGIDLIQEPFFSRSKTYCIEVVFRQGVWDHHNYFFLTEICQQQQQRKRGQRLKEKYRTKTVLNLPLIKFHLPWVCLKCAPLYLKQINVALDAFSDSIQTPIFAPHLRWKFLCHHGGNSSSFGSNLGHRCYDLTVQEFSPVWGMKITGISPDTQNSLKLTFQANSLLA